MVLITVESSGVCKWAQDPDEVEFALGVLERLAKRYGTRKGLLGIQPLNEPITEKMWKTMDVAASLSTGRPGTCTGFCTDHDGFSP